MRSDERIGAYYALAAYTFWGVVPVYFVWVGFAQPLEILAQRVAWSVPVLALFITFMRGWSELSAVTKRQVAVLAVCSMLLSINWLTFIYAISAEKIVETSLGYFINPLVSVVLGRLFLGEQLRPLQWLAMAFACAGVCVELIELGELPWLGLTLAFTFGLYGLGRKQITLGAPLALGIETVLIAPFAVGYLVLFDLPERTMDQSVWLALGGLVTVIPLVCFGAAARRLPLTLLGFFQYIAPSLSLIIAVLLYNEAVSAARWWNLGLIWFGLMIFSVEAVLHQRRTTRGKVV